MKLSFHLFLILFGLSFLSAASEVQEEEPKKKEVKLIKAINDQRRKIPELIQLPAEQGLEEIRLNVKR